MDTYKINNKKASYLSDLNIQKVKCSNRPKNVMLFIIWALKLNKLGRLSLMLFFN